MQARNILSQLRTNLIWILTVNIALVILYLSVSHKIHSSDIDDHINNNKNQQTKTKTQNNWTVKSRNKPEIYTDNVVSSDCTGLVFPAHLTPEVTWRPVDKEQSAYAFSVYYLKEESKLVIIGAKVKDYTSYYCQFWYHIPTNHSYSMIQEQARVIVLPEGHGKR